MGYHFNRKSQFIKIYACLPNFVPKIRSLLHNGINVGSDIGQFAFQCYEANVPFILRFMIDNNIGGGYWLELPKGKYLIRDENEKVLIIII